MSKNLRKSIFQLLPQNQIFALPNVKVILIYYLWCIICDYFNLEIIYSSFLWKRSDKYIVTKNGRRKHDLLDISIDSFTG